MSGPGAGDRERRFERHDAEWRDPARAASLWPGDGEVDPELLATRVRGPFWAILEELDVTLLVSREYEHLLLALSVERGRPRVSYLPLPHPSGIAVDRRRAHVHVACTRNPNQVLLLRPAVPSGAERPTLLPVRSSLLPGSLYLHDLAFVGEALHANAVGCDAVVRLHEDGGYRLVWWPRCVTQAGGPVPGLNRLQLNSIAAGADLASSYFSASAERPGRRRPGQPSFPVDRRGVVFHGRSGEVVCRGLTRPHSARLAGGELWVANSGYGEVGAVRDGRFEPVTRLPGWTRGLCLLGAGAGVAFAGTSRVLPRFRRYAPGLDVERSVCAVHAVDAATGRALASVAWPAGNQVFGIDWLPRGRAGGLPCSGSGPRSKEAARRTFYSYRLDDGDEEGR